MKSSFTFIDLFAGIGGMRLGFENTKKFKCILTCEIDEDALKTYTKRFNKDDHPRVADIADLNPDDNGKLNPNYCIIEPKIIKPDKKNKKILTNFESSYDVLVGGFPCQPYSIAGLRKGLKDKRGQVFEEIIEILHRTQPKVFLLENVKGMLSHDNKKTYKTIMKPALERPKSRSIINPKALGYLVDEKVLNTMDYTEIPQNRERLFIVGVRMDIAEKLKLQAEEPKLYSDKKELHWFDWPEKIPETKKGKIINCISKDVKLTNPEYKKYFYNERYKQCYKKLNALIKRGEMHENTLYQYRRHYVRANKSNVCPTLTANMGSGGHNVPLYYDGKNVRKLTPRECANFQGFPEDFEFPDRMSDGKKYHQVGNSVTVPLIKLLAHSIKALLERETKLRSK